jgi:ribosome-binding protein aMBF1 (putative translation factor)
MLLPYAFVRTLSMYGIDRAATPAYRVSMEGVNDDIRRAVRIELARRDDKQARLAERIGVTRQYLNDVLRGKAGNVPAVWQKILDELDLELVVRLRTPERP